MSFETYGDAISEFEDVGISVGKLHAKLSWFL
jgi:hypothetical protein